MKMKKTLLLKKKKKKMKLFMNLLMKLFLLLVTTQATHIFSLITLLRFPALSTLITNDSAKYQQRRTDRRT